MILEETNLKGVYFGRLNVFEDERGFFAEAYRNPSIRGLPDTNYVQHNFFMSRRRVLRGLHYQRIHPQGKFMMPVSGMIYHAVVDLKTGSWYGRELFPFEFVISSEETITGTLVMTDKSVVYEMVTDYWYPGDSVTVAWNDPYIGIKWPMDYPILKREDANGKTFKEVFGG